MSLAAQVCDLDRNVRRAWQNLVEESLHEGASVRDPAAREKVDDDRQASLIRGVEDFRDGGDIRCLREIDARVSEVELEPAEPSALGASIELLERVAAEWIEAAERAKPVRECCDLISCPIVLGAN